ncbi:MAG: hypothetical protein KY469_14260 [Actinobacteria bacterium]|nr:hypothetical protein [Actinomycetota bacterium]
MARAGAVGLAIGLVVLAGACRDGLAFRDDHVLSITRPGDRAAVAVPFEVNWSVRDLPDGTRFAVLVDRTPPPAGEGLEWFARDDPGCTRDPECPDLGYLEGLHVHVTEDSSFTVTSVPRPERPDERELHDVTVILLDRDGRRIGETDDTVTVEVRRDR